MKNITRKSKLAECAVMCTSPLQKARGLIFRRRIKDEAYLFIFEKEAYVPLHMLFVFFPIDVLYLDGRKKVVEMKECFAPFAFYQPQKKARYVIELPAGTVKISRTRIGDAISF